ncbi:hypothetical protein VII00023_08089 [Vibrio ichthyoenteri ATCC 700023]|uniref:DUF3037 domain-containing protein n=1 Tax=Vibrio ichthyoenteri ATCC 700023 TaxID=870968 RepID=F9S1X3_9VIBR|nr:DUF3037 domain-containing protein [Vibrio ichthyoenteri]EGU40878.1 hypothetical protein VII00023_08089 [Vibrio ichthyoenteri ATCC 700023]
MKKLVRYSVIRFMPYTETQEFANVGVVVHVPQTGGILFRLASKRFARVSQFFDDLDGQLYSNAIEMFNFELLRIKDFAKDMRGKNLAGFMDEVTRQREGFLIFSETAALLTSDSLELVLEKLFEQYVGRSFNTKEHRETLLVSSLKKQLDGVSKYKFTKSKLNADYVSFELPLVATNGLETKAIKPLSFYQDKPLKLIDHGEFWISRIKHLLNSNTLEPSNFLFAIDCPEYKDMNLEAAFMSLHNEMQSLGVNVIDVHDLRNIEMFARFDSESSEHFQLAH